MKNSQAIFCCHDTNLSQLIMDAASTWQNSKNTLAKWSLASENTTVISSTTSKDHTCHLQSADCDRPHPKPCQREEKQEPTLQVNHHFVLRLCCHPLFWAIHTDRQNLNWTVLTWIRLHVSRYGCHEDTEMQHIGLIWQRSCCCKTCHSCYLLLPLSWVCTLFFSLACSWADWEQGLKLWQKFFKGFCHFSRVGWHQLHLRVVYQLELRRLWASSRSHNISNATLHHCLSDPLLLSHSWHYQSSTHTLRVHMIP